MITFVFKINNMSIQDRIKMVIKMHNLSSSAFADKIGVQRSSVSHILTGRNNPSLDFIEKTLKNFPRVNADWLILGKTVTTTIDTNKAINDEKKLLEPEMVGNHDQDLKSEKQQNNRTIDRIVVFYSDGTFEETIPSNKSSAE